MGTEFVLQDEKVLEIRHTSLTQLNRTLQDGKFYVFLSQFFKKVITQIELSSVQSSGCQMKITCKNKAIKLISKETGQFVKI